MREKMNQWEASRVWDMILGFHCLYYEKCKEPGGFFDSLKKSGYRWKFERDAFCTNSDRYFECHMYMELRQRERDSLLAKRGKQK